MNRNKVDHAVMGLATRTVLVALLASVLLSNVPASGQASVPDGRGYTGAKDNRDEQDSTGESQDAGPSEPASQPTGERKKKQGRGIASEIPDGPELTDVSAETGSSTNIVSAQNAAASAESDRLNDMQLNKALVSIEIKDATADIIFGKPGERRVKGPYRFDRSAAVKVQLGEDKNELRVLIKGTQVLREPIERGKYYTVVAENEKYLLRKHDSYPAILYMAK